MKTSFYSFTPLIRDEYGITKEKSRKMKTIMFFDDFRSEFLYKNSIFRKKAVF